jgi:long-chain acyl-CoA synthetase
MVEATSQGDGVVRNVQYATWLAGTEKAGYSRELVNIKDNKIKDWDAVWNQNTIYGGETINTILKAFLGHARNQPNANFLGTRQKLADGNFGEYVWQSYADVARNVGNLARGIMKLGLCPVHKAENDEWRFCGVWARNRAEWLTTLLAGMHFRITNVGFYDAMSIQAVDYILKQTEIETIFCEGGLVKKIIEMKKKGLAVSLKNIVLYDEIEKAQITEATEHNLVVRTFGDIMTEGERASEKEFPFVESKPADTYIFSYTSGTTGDSKGVKLAHRNILASAVGVFDFVDLNQNDVLISYLPYPHSFEQCVTAAIILVGGSIGYYQGNPLKLTEDCMALQPTLFPSVPRLYNKIYGTIKQRMAEATGCKRWLIDRGFAAKTANAPNGIYTHGCYDALIFKKVKALLGGRVRAMITGSAPIDLEVLNYLKVCFCVPIQEGYGLTETSAAATVTRAEDPNAGHVGGPILSLRIRLKDVPEMGYTANDKPYPRGEVCMKGPSVFSGYFKRPDKTAEAFDDDNWFRSGDVGQVYPNGSIKIIDRAKNIFKLSQGEYIAPEKLENIFVLSTYVEQSFVYGDSLKNCLVVVVFPKQAAVDKFKNENPGVDHLTSTAFKKAVLDDMNRLATEHHCSSLEKPKAIHLVADGFSVDNDLLTPTFKLKRNIAKNVFQTQIDQMYEVLTAAGL